MIIDLPDAIKNIPNQAFANCFVLRFFRIPTNVEWAVSIH